MARTQYARAIQIHVHLNKTGVPSRIKRIMETFRNIKYNLRYWRMFCNQVKYITWHLNIDIVSEKITYVL